MKLKIAVWICIILLVTELSACANTDEAPLPDIDTNTPKSSEELADILDQIGNSEEVTRSSGMNAQELLADLNSRDEFFAEFSPNAGFVAADIQINQRNTEKKQSDEIYADITSVNEFSSFIAEFYLHYTYYSTGGWRLDTVRQNRDGVYYITYWPDEADLRQVWDDTYSEIYDGGTIETCEIESTGTDYVMFLVNFSNSSAIATRYQKTEVRFGFADGLWTTASMLYPGEFEAGDPRWVLHSDAVQGLYLGITSDDDSIQVIIENFYTSDSSDANLHQAGLSVDIYEYSANQKDFQTNYSGSVARSVDFDFDTVEGGYTPGSKMRLTDGTWYNGGIKMERMAEFPDAPLTEDSARSLIQQIVEERGFEYWENYEAAQRANGQAKVDAIQDSWQEVLQNESVMAYQQACINYYSQVDFIFPEDLDPCMYTLYITETNEFLIQRGGSPSLEYGFGEPNEEFWMEFLTIKAEAPYARDYMDWTLSEFIDSMFYSYAMAHGIS